MLLKRVPTPEEVRETNLKIGELLTGIPPEEIPRQQLQRPKPTVRVKLKGASALTEKSHKVLKLITGDI